MQKNSTEIWRTPFSYRGCQINQTQDFGPHHQYSLHHRMHNAAYSSFDALHFPIEWSNWIILSNTLYFLLPIPFIHFWNRTHKRYHLLNVSIYIPKTWKTSTATFLYHFHHPRWLSPLHNISFNYFIIGINSIDVMFYF